jgi:hypothetical protein
MRTIIIAIHKLPVGSFTFLQCLSGTELLNLSEKPYIYFKGRLDSDGETSDYMIDTICDTFVNRAARKTVNTQKSVNAGSFCR